MARELNFIECDSSYQEAEIVIIGCPYDGTSSYRPGSRFAPSAIREASDGLETYSPYLDFSLEEQKVCDDGDLVLPFGDKQAVLRIIRQRVKQYLRDRKKVLALGGEHLISRPVIQEYAQYFPDMRVIHLDAHADLREDYLGEKESHATVMKRVYDIIEAERIYHFGIRSGTKEEFDFAKAKGHFYPYNLKFMSEILSQIPVDLPLYITIDLDVLDPSIFPGTGTPEPGGITFKELLSGIHALKDKNIVGADVVELSPNYDQSKVSDITAAKVVREMLLML